MLILQSTCFLVSNLLSGVFRVTLDPKIVSRGGYTLVSITVTLESKYKLTLRLLVNDQRV